MDDNNIADMDFSRLPVSEQTGKPVIHFAHANGIPSRVYQTIFDSLRPRFTIEYIPILGYDEQGKLAYPIDNHWRSLTQQIIDSVTKANKKHGIPIIGFGHSLGALCTLQAMYQKPELFAQSVLMDPPLIYGRDNFVWHLAKLTSSKIVDKMSPAGISKHRRDVWDSREQAKELLRPKKFFKDFDARTFDAYIEYGLSERDDGKVTLTIAKADEVAVFRTNPSLYWLTPNKPPKKPVTLIVAKNSKFFERKFPQKIRKRLSIPFKVFQGSHMFPLEHPEAVAHLVAETIVEQSSL